MRIRVLGLIAVMAAVAGPSVPSASEFRGGFSAIRTPAMGFHGRFGGQLRRAVVPKMGFHRPFFRRFQSAFHRPFHGGWNVPLYLNQDYGYPTVVVIQQGGEPLDYSANLLSVPSVGGLPVVMGIREARPDRPEIQVLNEPVAARIAPRAGARIVSVPTSEPASAPTPEPSSGVRIVHLTVPVGSR
jgi:hypothetical protein